MSGGGDAERRALARLGDAYNRGHGAESPTALRLHPHAQINVYLGLMRDITQLAQLRLTEKGDVEAIRADHDLKVRRLEGEVRQVELAIAQDRDAFDALRRDNKEIVMKLMEMGAVDKAIELQTRFLETFGGSTLDKLIASQGADRQVKLVKR
jgi:hypothetical protein